MAFAATTAWEVNSGGDDTNNGGGFDPASANFATDLAATSATGSSPVVTSASYTFAAGDVGAWLFVQSGTNWTPGWYQIASVSAGAATLTAGIGTAPLYFGGGPAGMSTAAGCATTASPTGGVWGVDYSQSISARYTFTDMVIDGTTNTKFTSAANPVGKNFVGNIISVTSGTGFTVQRVQIVSTSTTTATCDKSLGTLSSTGGNGRLGGALASPGKAGGLAAVAGMQVAIRTNATYSMSGSNNAAGGPVQIQAGSHWWGYSTNRFPYNSDTRPVIQPNANSLTLFDCFISTCRFGNLDLANGNSNTGCRGISDNSSVGNFAYNIRGTSLFQTIVFVQSGNTIERCEAISNDAATATGAFSIGNNGLIRDSVCRGGGFINGNTSTSRALNCIVSGGSMSGGHFAAFEGFQECRDCDAYNQGSSGSGFKLNAGGVAHGCVAVGNAAYGFKFASASPNNRLINCAAYNNTTAATDTTTIATQQQTSFVTLAGNPFTNAGSNDFTTNSTAGAGALLRAAGYPATLPGLSGADACDIGAYQHADPATVGGGGGGGGGPTPAQGLSDPAMSAALAAGGTIVWAGLVIAVPALLPTAAEVANRDLAGYLLRVYGIR